MKKAFTLAVLLCLHTPAVYAKLEPLAPLVEVIALQESDLNPFAVNIAGRSYTLSRGRMRNSSYKGRLRLTCPLTLEKCK